MLGKITREGEHARAVPELEHPVEVKLLLGLLGEQEFVVADQE